jgi:peptide chain release factor 1
MKQLQPKIKEIKKEAEQVNQKLSNPQNLSSNQIKKLSQKQAFLNGTVDLINQYQKIEKQIRENKEIIKNEPEMAEMAEEENLKLKPRLKELEDNLIEKILTSDEDDNKDVILEIRAGTGGEEAELFATDLFRMYQRYADNNNWQFEITNSKRTELGGIKEVSVEIAGNQVYKALKYEGGTHRVQRVPETEKSGRIHTSAATVAVLPQAEEGEIKINNADLKFESFRSSGPGGQSVNTTDSAVRVTHKPTGVSVSCQDEKSQLKNKEKALKILKAKIKQEQIEKKRIEQGEKRRDMIGSGDRSEKIRTYNFPQNRVSDHRINFTSHKLEEILNGNLGILIKKLQTEDQKSKLANLD